MITDWFLYPTESVVWENQHCRRKDFGYKSFHACSRMCWWLCWETEQGAISFPIDTPLVLRLVKTHMGKCLFSPELKSYLITQWNCTTIGSCRCRKTNQWVGSGAARTYGDDTRQYSRRNGRGIWLYKRSFRHRILRFFLLQRRRLRLHWSREAYSPLTRLAVGPSDLDLLGWSAFNAPQHRSSSGPVRCRYPAIT